MSRFTFALLLFALFSRGQAEPVKFPEGNAAWTVEFRYHSSSQEEKNTAELGSASRKATRVDIVQTNRTRRMRITWSDGLVSERWTLQDLPVVFEEDPREPDVIVAVENGSLRNECFDWNVPCDSSAFSWINRKNLQNEEPVEYAGKSCFHYKGSIVSPTVFSDESETTINVEAWIDSRTLRPFARGTDNMLAVFSFHEKPPSEVLVIPQKFKSRIDRYKKLAGIP